VRRDTSDPLYRKVLERFVQLATDAGLTQGVFPEGKLTRDGTLQPPKLGLLSYLLKGFNPQGERDLVFVPVGINYDRVLEDRTHALGLPVSVAGARQMAAWGLRWLWNGVRGKGHRLGYAAVNFGRPISTRELLSGVGDVRSLSQEAFRELVSRVGERLWQAVAATVPATPIPVFCCALLGEPSQQGVSVSTLYQTLDAQVHRFRELGVLVPELETGELFHFARRVVLARGWVREEGGQLIPVPEALPLLRFYANSLAHHG
jgi:glycerol-3-phosphate O-acyltransferase